MTSGTEQSDSVGQSGVVIAGREEILRVLLKAGVAVILGTLLLLLLFEGMRVVFWPYVSLLAGHAAAWVLLRRRRLRLAVLAHSGVYIATILLVLHLYGGLRSPASFVMSPIVLMVGLVWSGRAAIATAAACSAGMLGLIVVSALNGTFERRELTYWVVATAVLVLTSVVLSLALRSIGRAQSRALAAERERYALREQLHRANRLETVARLAAGVAHDFNNLLNVIVGQAGRIGRHGDPVVAAGAQQIEDAAWRAAALTQKLLEVGGRQSLETRELELNEMVRGLEPLLRGGLGDRPERLDLELGGGRLRLHADATRLEQVLVNLVRNAGDATIAGGEIRVRTGYATGQELAALPTWEPAVEAAIRIEVVDTGTGMSPEVQAHLFEPFFTTKEPGRGTGLGLASIYGIVQQSGGAITVESAVGRGSAFRVYLPALAAGPEASAGGESA